MATVFIDYDNANNNVNVMKDVVPLNQQSTNRSCNVQFVFVFFRFHYNTN